MQRGFIGEPSRSLEAASSDSGGLLGSAPASQLVPGGHGQAQGYTGRPR